MLTQDKLLQQRADELFHYVDGVLYWKVTKSATAVRGSVAGSVNARGHINLQFDKKMYAAHQIVWLLHHGYIPSEIDHINRIKTDNRIENLRETTSSGNKGNIALLSNNRSGYRGVSLNSRSGKWHAQIKIHGKQTYIGRFDIPLDAARAYNAAAVEHFGEFAYLNEVSE
jgi:hypothetical protein